MRWLAITAPVAALTFALTAASAPAVGPSPLASRAARTVAPNVDTATFAGGCFWSMERPFDNTPGVISATAGYTGGKVVNPSYEHVSTGATGHVESVEVVFDPSKVSYDRLLDIYWHNIDPVTPDGQFCDHGDEYRTAIFYHGEAQHQAALQSLKVVQAHFSKSVSTEIRAAGPFYSAEAYHQHFAERNPVRYNIYRRGCGRDARLKAIWGAAAEPNVPPL